MDFDPLKAWDLPTPSAAATSVNKSPSVPTKPPTAVIKPKATIEISQGSNTFASSLKNDFDRKDPFASTGVSASPPRKYLDCYKISIFNS
jgi:hypothetical protein